MIKFATPRKKDIVQIITLSLAVLATVVYLVETVVDQDKMRAAAIDSMIKSDRMMQRLEVQKKMVDEASKRNDDLLREIATITKSPNNSESQRQILALKQDISNIKSELSSVRSGVSTLNDALGANAEKAIALPLLKEDVEDLKSYTQRDLDSLRGEMTRSYDVTKWLIGLIIAALLGLVLNNVRQSRSVARNVSSAKFE